MSRKAPPDPHEIGGGDFTYGGQVFTGKQAEYLRAARGIAIRGDSPSSDLTPDQTIALLSAKLARDGIDFDRWRHWTLDQMDLYLEGRSLQLERTNEQIRMMSANAKANEADPMIRYVVPLE